LAELRSQSAANFNQNRPYAQTQFLPLDIIQEPEKLRSLGKTFYVKFKMLKNPMDIQATAYQMILESEINQVDFSSFSISTR
jgi:hypothetical protein